MYFTSVSGAAGKVTFSGLCAVLVGAAGGSPQGQSTLASVAGSHFPVLPSHVILTWTLASVSQVYVQVVALSPVGSHFLVVPVGAAGAVDSLHSKEFGVSGYWTVDTYQPFTCTGQLCLLWVPFSCFSITL